MADMPRDALAAKYFPVEWARFATKPGASKQRQKLRKQAEDADKVFALAASGAKCGNCASYCTQKIPGLEKRCHCELMSNFHGYVFVEETQLCPSWRNPPANPSAGGEG